MIIKHSLEDVMIKVVLSSFTPDVQLRATHRRRTCRVKAPLGLDKMPIALVE